MVPITETSDQDRTAREDATPPSVVAAEEGESSETLLCWVCRRPLRDAEAVRWRGEPVHRDCP